MTTAVTVRKPTQPIVIPRAPDPQPVVSSVKALREARYAERERMIGDLVRQWSEVLGRFVSSPPMMVVGGCAITNILSQTQTGEYNGRPTYVLEGSISTAIQTTLVTGAALNALVEVAKPAVDIAQLIKLIGLI